MTRGYVVALMLLTALAPTFAENWGAGIAVEWGTLPDEWPVVGGRTVFGDVIYLGGDAILGGSITAAGAGGKDNGIRFFGAVWMERGGNWVVGLSQRVAGF